MKILKALWNKLVKATASTSTIVEVQSDTTTGDIFAHMCREAGVKTRELDSTNAVALFVEWYKGTPDEENIRNAIEDFKREHPAVNAKLSGKL
jgi:hypothetical protein